MVTTPSGRIAAVPPSPRRSGRPRDPDVDRRALAAAREVYGERGWSGLSLEEVARRSSIGKGSLYLRWPTRAALLVAAVRDRARFVADIDTGSLREDLVTFAEQWTAFATSDDGRLVERLLVDSHRVPEIAAALADDAYPEHVRGARTMVRRGIDRGELPAGTSVALVADLVAGAVRNHVATTPAHLAARDGGRGYAAAVVDTVLAGVRARAQPSP
ncbi:Transcriptional regulator, TetR family [Pseudonocardia sp. Ae406_Ps2]|nr:Transcriptional regulator, TetR family [Pseudonocardia sp. Ae331_Ps2]OLM05629.1 Transcriptional regulator, TetR family [Pseudonocardia sp. Ae406_Ps2]OLM15422.1 Transcriptional regulator, TetR family [Pseudonocardia sp. Ae505_Ps2]OLM27204.1 Transcriptional regulator, TetR family [Pseudonocardia sp. Ae706_Ps2]